MFISKDSDYFLHSDRQSAQYVCQTVFFLLYYILKFSLLRLACVLYKNSYVYMCAVIQWVKSRFIYVKENCRLK